MGLNLSKYGQYMDILVAQKPCVRWPTVSPKSKISLTARNSGNTMCMFLWNIHETYELVFIFGNWVSLGRFLLKNWGCVGPRRSAASCRGDRGCACGAAAGRGSPGLVSSSLSMAIYMGDGSHL